MEEAAKETVIIVHGTYAAPKPGVSHWYQPTEGLSAPGFITKLNDALAKRGSAARCWGHCSHGDQGFHWSGSNSWIDRTRAASELGSYVLNLRKAGRLCHIVAHSHGGNIVLEALPQITASIGNIVTLGTPFMDATSSISKRVRGERSLKILSSWLSITLLISLFILGLIFLGAVAMAQWFPARGTIIVALGLMILLVIFVLIVMGARFNSYRKNLNAKTIFNGGVQLHPKFLAIGSVMDEPWQLLHHMRNTPNPMAVKTNLIRYLMSCLQSDISRSRQIGHIYEAKSYSDLKLMAKLVLAITHLLFLFSVLPFIALVRTISFKEMLDFWLLWIFTLGAWWYAWLFWVLIFASMFGPEFTSAFFAPLRWCVYCVGAIKGTFGELATYIVRSRGWSVVLAIAMGLEGYRHQLPRIEQYPSSVPSVTYENMPAGAQERALAKRGAWIDRHLDNIAQTFSKLVVTSADITMLQHAIEADQTLVHAAYYTDDECIARIADWIAAKQG